MVRGITLWGRSVGVGGLIMHLKVEQSLGLVNLADKKRLQMLAAAPTPRFGWCMPPLIIVVG